MVASVAVAIAVTVAIAHPQDSANVKLTLDLRPDPKHSVGFGPDF